MLLGSHAANNESKIEERVFASPVAPIFCGSPIVSFSARHSFFALSLAFTKDGSDAR